MASTTRTHSGLAHFPVDRSKITQVLSPCRHDNLNHRSKSSQSSMAVIHEELIRELKVDGSPVKTYYQPPLETIAQNLILL